MLNSLKKVAIFEKILCNFCDFKILKTFWINEVKNIANFL